MACLNPNSIRNGKSFIFFSCVPSFIFSYVLILFINQFKYLSKYLVKITKTRVETVKRKKNSVCKYLKKDIVDLLNNNLDYNAYGRVTFFLISLSIVLLINQQVIMYPLYRSMGCVRIWLVLRTCQHQRKNYVS